MKSVAEITAREFSWFSRNRFLTVLLIILPALLVLLVVAAVQHEAVQPVALLIKDEDKSDESAEFIDVLRARADFVVYDAENRDALELLRAEMEALLTIPEGWGDGLSDGEPLPLNLAIDAIHPQAARRTQRVLQETLRQFQQDRLEQIITDLPNVVIELAKQVPVPTRRQFVSWMAPWTVEAEYLFNASLRSADYVIPGVIGLVVQFFAVLLMAGAIPRERESGEWETLQAEARRGSIVCGKALAHGAVWLVSTTVAIAAAYLVFPAAIQRPFAVALPVIAFLAASIGVGALIASLCRTQAQAGCVALIYLLPGVVMAGVFDPAWQLPRNLHALAHVLPLTYFAGAFRDLTMLLPRFPNITGDLVIMIAIAGVTFAAAIVLLPVRKSS